MATSKETKNSFGGLKIRNTNEINITLFCELCKLLQLHPVQLLCCGICLCRWCAKRGVSNSEPFICPFCQTNQPKIQAQADRGIERELNMLKIECYACSWSGSYKDYLNHLQQDHADLECSDCHARFFAINSFEEHRQEICEYRRIPCGLPGCVEMINWSEMRTHYLCIKHQMLLIEWIITYYYQKQHSSYNSNYLTTKSNVISHTTQEMIAIQESLDLVSSGLVPLSNDSTRLRSEHDHEKTTCDRTISQINDTKKTFDEHNGHLIKCIELQNEIEKEIDNTKILYKFINTLLLDADGTVTFYFRKHNEELNSPFSIYSPKFKTAPYGYLFTLRVCSTIESTNENQGYLSIYITLLRGDFDQILFYPFPYSIYLYLCDQSGQKKHISSVIQPDLNSSSFARPRSERNDEIGIIKFCPLNYLTDTQSIYLKDGVFFIRIFIDFMNTGPVSFA